MQTSTPALTKRQRSALALAAFVIIALLASPYGRTAGPRPFFQMPLPCGQIWEASTYANHGPDPDSIDLAQRQDGDNISEGEPVLASADATVIDAFKNAKDEYQVDLDHGDGWKTRYIHLEQDPPLTAGQFVAQGEQIGRVSNSGIDNATVEDMHLHYTQLKDGDAVQISFNGRLIDTHEADPDSWGKWSDEDAEKLTSLNCPGNSFLGFNQNGFRYQLLYKPGSGAAKTVRMDADGTGVTTVMSGTWTKGWTHHTPFTLSGGQQHLFSYKSSTGRVRFARINSGGASTTGLMDGTWGKGWTHFVPFSRGSKPYFIAYNSLYGHANIERVNAEGSGSSTISAGTWGKGWTQIVPFELNADQYLLLYKGGTGVVEINEITGSGNEIELTEVWSGTWTKGWTHLVPLMHHGARHLLGYKAASGKAKFMKLSANGQGVQTLGEASWTKSWTTFSPLSIEGDAHVLAYKTGTGEVKTLKLNDAGTGITSIWADGWTSGWA